MMERLPRARGPNSMRPWNQPSPLPSARSPAARPIDLVVVEPLKAGARLLEPPAAFVVVVGRPEIGAVHAVELVLEPPWTGLVQVIGGERRAQRAAGVAGRRLDPDTLELAVAQHLAVRHAVERHAAGHAEIFGAGLGRDRAREPHHDFLGHRLDRGREIHVALVEPFLRLARRPAEQRIELVAGHAQTGAIVEIGLIQPERAVGLEVDQVVEDEPGIFRLAIRREPHHLVLARIDLEAGVVGERRVEQPQRMREMQLFAHLQVVAAPEADRRGRPFADPVHGEDDRLLERRRKEGGRGVALVVLREQKLALPIEVGIERAKLVAQELLLEQLLLQPQRDRHAEGAEAPGSECEIGFEQPFELEERLVVERDMIDVGEADAGLGQAIGDGVMRETGIVLLAGEALLLGGGDDLSVDDQCRGAIVVERGQSENSHPPGSSRPRRSCR